MDYDQVLDHVGQFGLWQVLVCALASLAAMSELFMTMQVRCLKFNLESPVKQSLRRFQTNEIH